MGAPMLGVGSGGGWMAGVSSRSITPVSPAWLAGYAHRDQRNKKITTELMTKAVSLMDGKGNACVTINVELVGVSAAMTAAVREHMQARCGLPASCVRVIATHTHSAPCITSSLHAPHPCNPLLESRAEQVEVEQYTASVISQMKEAAESAFHSMAPATLHHGTSRLAFAVNRRENEETPATAHEAMRVLHQVARDKRLPPGFDAAEAKGAMDHTLDLLCIKSASDDTKVLACMFGYACHCTVLDACAVSGDWAGYAASHLQDAMPSCVAMFLPGCGGDQNPVRRRHVNLANAYGLRVCQEVVSMIQDQRMVVLDGPVTTSRVVVNLPFERLPTPEELKKQAQLGDSWMCPTLTPQEYDEAEVASKNAATNANLHQIVGKAKKQWALILLQKQTYPESLPYPITVWQFGPKLAWIALAGEPTVDYVHRLRRELEQGGRRVWVSGYSEDVMAYVPSERVLAEGGYEGGESMLWYGKPSRWKPGLENVIVSACVQAAGQKTSSP